MLLKEPPQVAPEWLTPAQAARHLGVTPAMVRYWTRHGHVDYQMTPLGRLIGAESVERLRRARAADPRLAEREGRDPRRRGARLTSASRVTEAVA